MIPPLFKDWPEVPMPDRPKKLFHAGLVTLATAEHLRQLGWEPLDVRLLPNKSDIDRAEGLKDWLEGVRLGTIEPDPKAAKFVELEARVYGLAQGKSPSGKRSNEADTALVALQDANTVLQSIGQSSPFALSADEKAARKQKKNGRPPKE